jgi:hypothetical protein
LFAELRVQIQRGGFFPVEGFVDRAGDVGLGANNGLMERVSLREAGSVL